MTRCGWYLAVILLLGLYVGYGVVSGVSPYNEKPNCPPGPGPTFKAIHKITNKPVDCFYKLKLTKKPTIDKDDKYYSVSATVDRSVIEENLKLTAGFQFSDLTRRFLDINNYPFFEYNFQAEGDLSNLEVGSVVHFVSNPDTSRVILLTPELKCTKKEEQFRKHLDYHGGYINDITEEEVKECPNLGKIPNKKPA